MFAVVARTFGAVGVASLRSRQVRVTHTLLFIAALAVSPGVCGACARGCPENGLNRSDTSLSTGVFFAVATTRGHGSCCGTMDGPSQGSQSPGLRPHTTADVADGILNFHSDSLACCNGGAECDCLLEPRGDPAAAVTAASEAFEPRPFTVAEASILPTDGLAVGAVARQCLPDKPPSRPVRVLYGVWRT